MVVIDNQRDYWQKFNPGSVLMYGGSPAFIKDIHFDEQFSTDWDEEEPLSIEGEVELLTAYGVKSVMTDHFMRRARPLPLRTGMYEYGGKLIGVSGAAEDEYTLGMHRDNLHIVNIGQFDPILTSRLDTNTFNESMLDLLVSMRRARVGEQFLYKTNSDPRRIIVKYPTLAQISGGGASELGSHSLDTWVNVRNRPVDSRSLAPLVKMYQQLGY